MYCRFGKGQIVTIGKSKVIVIDTASRTVRKQGLAFHQHRGEHVLHFHRDLGAGIPDEDIPFVFDKFYRGKNINQVEGSGLGLYIVKYIMEKMNGKVELESDKEGVEVRLYLLLN